MTGDTFTPDVLAAIKAQDDIRFAQCEEEDRAHKGRQKEKGRAAARAWYWANREAVLARAKLNPAAHAAAERARYAANPARSAAKCRAWREANPARSAEKNQAGNARRVNRLPPWYCRESCIPFYQQARDLTASTGIPHQVDHVIPLQGELVSGLHVAANLQVLTRAANQSKKNHFDPMNQ